MTRAENLARLANGSPFDVLVVGGGIAGAGLALEAARAGARTALAEARDFASGTSSRSSKLVHGGLRYLAQGKFGLTRESVRERTALLRDAPGLVMPQEFLVPVRAGGRNGKLKLGLALAVYDFFAGARSRRWRDAAAVRAAFPAIATEGLQGGWSYLDAATDDARLVLRTLAEARRYGAVAVNYLQAENVSSRVGDFSGVRLRDETSGASFDLAARLVVNAAGAWSDRLRGQVGAAPKLRPLRGSHLMFAADRFPLANAVGFYAEDGRPVFAVPWEGAVLVGTTDIDHRGDLDIEPSIARAEVDYLMRAVRTAFPALDLVEEDIVSTWAGVRPVVASGAHVDPSKEARDHLIVEEGGLLTVTGGKLTTFRATAVAALRAAAARAPALAGAGEAERILQQPARRTTDALAGLPPAIARRWLARYGDEAALIPTAARPGETETIGATPTTWAELRWAFRAEDVVHLDDAMLRRTRLGLLLRDGGAAILPRVGEIAREEMRWDDARWRVEEERYRALIARCYSVPARP
ncbi:MAG TPA: glycerol-3-phosphate dehydrogenase/oxidase [Rhodoblastus sp.]|nr:glycerol-3-phosphate dehydrogenase/oxidase [Rhodoblastus sp.]